MNSEYHIKQIEKLLNSEQISEFDLLQISFDIACVKLKLSNGTKYIAKYYITKKNEFNALTAEAENLRYLRNIFNFFPEVIHFNNDYLIIEYIENNSDKPNGTNRDFLESIIKIHSVSNKKYGFDFNTQIGALEQINDFEQSWTNFFINKRLNPIFELANNDETMGHFINKKMNFIMNNIKNFIPDNPLPLLLHGDMWEGNILFNDKNFIGFIDPGSFFGHNEMELAYLRWFNPIFIDDKFISKYNEFIEVNKNFFDYEPIYQIYYALCNVVLWDKSYVSEVKSLINKLGL